VGLSISLQDVRARWPELIRAVRSRDLQLQALLRAGEPVVVENNTIFIRFKYGYHAQRVSESRNQQLLEEVLRQMIGQPVRVRCLLPGESPAERVHVPEVADLGGPADQAVLESLRSEVLQLRSEQQRLEADITRLRTVVTRAKATLETIVGSIEAGRREIARLDSRHSELVEQNRQLELALQTLNQESQPLNLEVIRLREQKESTAEEVKSLQETVSQLAVSRNGLEAEIAGLKKEKTTLENRTRSSVDLPPIKGLDNIIGRR